MPAPWTSAAPRRFPSRYIGDRDTGPAIVRVKIIVVVTSNTESREAGAEDIEGVIFKPIGRKKVALHFGGHLELARNALFLDHAADQLHAFNERSHLVGHHKQQALVILCTRQI